MLFPASRLETGPDGIGRSESSIIWVPFFLFRFREPKVCAIGNSFLSKSCGLLALEGVCLFFTGSTCSSARWQTSGVCIMLKKISQPNPSLSLPQKNPNKKKPTTKHSGDFYADSSYGFVSKITAKSGSRQEHTCFARQE